MKLILTVLITVQTAVGIASDFMECGFCDSVSHDHEHQALDIITYIVTFCSTFFNE